MKELFADVVFRTTFLKNKNTLILLLEHKSAINRALIIQFLKYILEILSQNIQDKKPFNFVLPIIIYHDDKKSKPKPLYGYYKNMPSYLYKFIPFVDFIFVNLGTISNEELLDLSDDILLKSTFLALKNVQDANFIKSHFNAFVNFFSNNPNYKNYLKKILVYLYNHSAIKRDEFDSLIASQTNKSLKMNLTVAKGA